MSQKLTVPHPKKKIDRTTLIVLSIIGVVLLIGCVILGAAFDYALGADGSIDEKEFAVCREIAAWMKSCGECVRGVTVADPCAEGPLTDAIIKHKDDAFNERFLPKPTDEDIRYTKKGDVVYAIALVPPEEGKTPAFKALGSRKPNSVERLPQVGACPAVWKISF